MGETVNRKFFWTWKLLTFFYITISYFWLLISVIYLDQHVSYADFVNSKYVPWEERKPWKLKLNNLFSHSLFSSFHICYAIMDRVIRAKNTFLTVGTITERSMSRHKPDCLIISLLQSVRLGWCLFTTEVLPQVLQSWWINFFWAAKNMNVYPNSS